MPHTRVSQSGMLSRLPGAKNLPNKPIMMPITITNTQPMLTSYGHRPGRLRTSAGLSQT